MLTKVVALVEENLLAGGGVEPEGGVGDTKLVTNHVLGARNKKSRENMTVREKAAGLTGYK